MIVKFISLGLVVGVAVVIWSFPGMVNVSVAGAETVEFDVSPDIVQSAAGDKHGYIGSKKCKKCHLNQYKSWAKTKMAKAFELLKPGERAEAKKKHGLDPAKDFTTDTTCLPCHTTGYGKKGGYAIPTRAKYKTEKAFKKAVRKAKALEGIGCEACHGPGSDYEKIHKDVLKSERKYDPTEFYKAGQNEIGIKVCEACHNEKNPMHDKTNPFDYEKRKDEGTHKHEKLKFRIQK